MPAVIPCAWHTPPKRFKAHAPGAEAWHDPREAARQRIAAQPSQEEKVAAADIVIRNDGSFEDTWRQVYAFRQELFPEGEETPETETVAIKGEVRVEKARPQEAGEIAAFITVPQRRPAKLYLRM